MKILYKKQILKSGLFNNGFYGQDIVMVFSPTEYCRLFAQKKAYQGGGHGHPRTPPSYAPALDVRMMDLFFKNFSWYFYNFSFMSMVFFFR